MTAAERAERTSTADALCQDAWASVGGPDAGAALVAVGVAFDGEVTGTPTVFVNGEKLADSAPATITAAVDEALAS